MENANSSQRVVQLNTGNNVYWLSDRDEGKKLFDLEIYNKVVNEENVLLVFSDKIEHISLSYAEGLFEYWIKRREKEWIKKHIHVHPQRLEEEIFIKLRL